MGSDSFRAFGETGAAAIGSGCCHTCGEIGAAATMGSKSFRAGGNVGAGTIGMGSNSFHPCGDAGGAARGSNSFRAGVKNGAICGSGAGAAALVS
jgi:hypothetical protein